MTLIICPGIHDPALSDRFCQTLKAQLPSAWPAAHEPGVQPGAILPTQRYAPFNGWSVYSYWQTIADPQRPLLIIAFSAGVVGAIAAAQLWQAQGGAIAAMIAVDGWGVPQLGEFPLYRVSHDHFTHWSSALLGAGQDSFYADPPVDHLDLWQSPECAIGLWIPGNHSSQQPPKRVTAIEFIANMLLRHDSDVRLG